MNKILIYGIGVGIIILIIGVTYLPGIINQTIYLNEYRKRNAIIDEIIDNRDCWGIRDLLKKRDVDFSGTQLSQAHIFSQHCKYRAEINDEGIDISNTHGK